MRPIKLIIYVLFITLTSNFLLYGMSGDTGGGGPGFPRGPHVPSVPAIAGEAQIDLEVAQVLEKIAREWQQKQEAQEESLERPRKRISKGKEEDTGQQPQSTEPEALSTITATTTTTSIQPRPESLQGSIWTEAELGDLRVISAPIPARRQSSQATILDEAEWAAFLQAVDQRTAREYAEEWFSEILPQIEGRLLDRDPNLINVIARRFFDRVVTLDELDNDTVSGSPYTIRLRVIAGPNQRITPEQIKRIGQMFPNVRELYLKRVGLTDEGLRTLLEQPIAQNLVRLNIRGNNLTATGISVVSSFTNLKILNIAYNYIGDAVLEAIARAPFASRLIQLNIAENNITAKGVQANIAAFTGLRRLNIGYISIGDEGLAALAQAPFAANLTELNIGSTDVTDEGVQANIAAFTNLRSLDIGDNYIGDEGLAALAQAPFAANLIELGLRHANITDEDVQPNIAAFTSLRRLNISENHIGDEKLEAIARAPFAHNLTYLNIGSSDITSSGIITYIGVFKSLKRLNISGNQDVDDRTLVALARQPFAHELLYLDLSFTEITGPGLLENIYGFTNLKTLRVEDFLLKETELIELEQQLTVTFNLSKFEFDDDDD